MCLLGYSYIGILNYSYLTISGFVNLVLNGDEQGLVYRSGVIFIFDLIDVYEI